MIASMSLPVMSVGAFMSFFPVGIHIRCTFVLPLINVTEHPVGLEVIYALLVFVVILSIFVNVLTTKVSPTPRGHQQEQTDMVAILLFLLFLTVPADTGEKAKDK